MGWAEFQGDPIASLREWEEGGYKEAWARFFSLCSKKRSPQYYPFRMVMTRVPNSNLEMGNGPRYLSVYSDWVPLDEQGYPILPTKRMLLDRDPEAVAWTREWERGGYKKAWARFFSLCSKKCSPRYYPFRMLLRVTDRVSFLNVYSDYVDFDERGLPIMPAEAMKFTTTPQERAVYLKVK
jgi:hypothetical protein